MYKTVCLKDKNIINTAGNILKGGGLMIYPTETCYGIGADATNQAAVDKLLAYKSRREGKPISIAVANTNMASTYVEINQTAQNLYDNYLPGPLTIVSKGKGKVATGIESEFGTLGIRIPDFPLITRIISRFTKPITATSANPSYQPKPYSIRSFLSHLPEKNKKLIDLVIDAGHLPHNETSTVVDTTLHEIAIIRKGKINLNLSKSSPRSLETSSAEETINLGSMLLHRYYLKANKYPLLFLLSGNLGAGKTQFVKGVARALHVPDIVRSPTYSLVNQYTFTRNHMRGTLTHIDTWRISGVKELKALSVGAYLKANSVTCIEWADTFLDELYTVGHAHNANVVYMQFSHISPEKRKIEIRELS